MLCPICQTEMRISNRRYKVKNDDTAEKATQLFAVYDYLCRKRDCPNYDKVVKEDSQELNID